MELTNTDVIDFRLVGTSRAIAHTNLGNITLDGIKVNVSTTLSGLQGLKGSTVIDGVDVAGGTSEGIDLNLEGAYFSFLIFPLALFSKIVLSSDNL